MRVNLVVSLLCAVLSLAIPALAQQSANPLATAQFRGCSGILGEAPPVPDVEKTKTSKTDVTQALKDSFTYCERAFAGLTDANAAATVSYYGSKAPKLSALSGTATHNMEHYGDLVTYLASRAWRPPSSEPRQ